MNDRLAHILKQQIALPADFEGTPDDIQIRILYTERDINWSPDEFSFYEMAAHIQGLRALLTGSSVIAADSLHIPGEEELEPNAIRNQDIDELIVRLTNLHARFEQLQGDWNTYFEEEVDPEKVDEHSFTEAQIEQLRTLLQQSSAFGIPGCIPDILFTNDHAAGKSLLLRGVGVSKALNDRMKQAGKTLATALDTSLANDGRVIAAVDTAKKILGKAFVLLPHFTLRNGIELKEQLDLPAEKGLLRGRSSYVMDQWLHGMGRVRERMQRVEQVNMWAGTFDRPGIPFMSPLQLPFSLDEQGSAADHWLGLPFPEGYYPEEDKLSMVLFNAAQLQNSVDQPQAALLLDEWVEIIPNPEETTGIAFQYDQPDAKAPNTLLLAVAPQKQGKWTWDDLVYTLEDTLELAKNRAVEPEHLEDTVFGQILPGIMTEIVPPQLLPEGADDSAEAQDNPLGLQVVTDFGVVNDTYVAPEE